ncbi:MAG: outer membrane beta-barrel protein [Muribaculaceae bacterium]|nr:outer membrane beta-barrel protein [Muribaculaceae bacterium]
MKKIILMAVMSVMTLSAAAQDWYVGGSVGAWRNNDDKVTTISFAPEFGCSINDTWSAGTVIGWTHVHRTNVDGNIVDFRPYARYNFFKSGMVSLFVDGGVDLGFGKTSYDGYGDSDTAVTYGLGFKPGVALSLNKHCSLVAHVGFLGFRGSNDAAKDLLDSHYEGWGFDFSSYNLSFGFYYTF